MANWPYTTKQWRFTRAAKLSASPWCEHCGKPANLVDLDPAKVLGRTRSGTLRLREDAKGLRFTVDLPDTTLAQDLLEMVRRGDVGDCSFGFVVSKGGERWQGKRRELRSVTLLEISIVSAWPAYSGTTVQARSLAQPKTQALKRLLETL